VILLDTSALYALADAADSNHAAARRALEEIEENGEDLFLHSYVLLESFALLHRCHGLEIAARVSRETRSLKTVIVDRDLHDEAVQWLEKVKGRGPSLVDAVSFLVMRRHGVKTAFAFDSDFEAAGFRVKPSRRP
jgi:predicted nucleic acid-binding protein